MVGQRPLHRCFLLINALWDVDHTLQRLVQFLSRGGVKVPTPSLRFAFHHFLMCLRILQLS
jgi:hypothetical protein